MLYSESHQIKISLVWFLRLRAGLEASQIVWGVQMSQQELPISWLSVCLELLPLLKVVPRSVVCCSHIAAHPLTVTRRISHPAHPTSSHITQLWQLRVWFFSLFAIQCPQSKERCNPHNCRPIHIQSGIIQGSFTSNETSSSAHFLSTPENVSVVI